MKFLRKILLINLLSLSFLQASELTDSLYKSDTYGKSVPKPVIIGNIEYTTPALQEINKKHFSLDSITKTIKDDSTESRVLYGEGVRIFLRRDANKIIKILSVTQKD